MLFLVVVDSSLFEVYIWFELSSPLVSAACLCCFYIVSKKLHLFQINEYVMDMGECEIILR